MPTSLIITIIFQILGGLGLFFVVATGLAHTMAKMRRKMSSTLSKISILSEILEDLGEEEIEYIEDTIEEKNSALDIMVCLTFLSFNFIGASLSFRPPIKAMVLLGSINIVATIAIWQWGVWGWWFCVFCNIYNFLRTGQTLLRMPQICRKFNCGIPLKYFLKYVIRTIVYLVIVMYLFSPATLKYFQLPLINIESQAILVMGTLGLIAFDLLLLRMQK